MILDLAILPKHIQTLIRQGETEPSVIVPLFTSDEEFLSWLQQLDVPIFFSNAIKLTHLNHLIINSTSPQPSSECRNRTPLARCLTK